MLQLMVTEDFCLIVGEGNWEESTSMAEGEVSETFIQAGLLHTKELREIFGRGPDDFRSVRRGPQGS